MIPPQMIIEGHISAPGVSMSVMTYRLDDGALSGANMPEYMMIQRYTPARFRAQGYYDDPLRQPRGANVGRLLFTPADFPVRFESTINEERVGCCIFDPKHFDQIADLGDSWSEDELESYLDVRNYAARDLMRRLAEESLAPGFASQILCESLGMALIVEIARHFRRERTGRNGIASLDQSAVRRIEDYINAACGDGSAPTIADLAKLCNVSPKHLMRNFKKTTGQTLHRFVENVRLQRAVDLLSGTGLSLKVIAWQTGFATPSRFSESFRRHTGMTPSAFRTSRRN